MILRKVSEYAERTKVGRAAAPERENYEIFDFIVLRAFFSSLET